jgi:hypothetical protein
MPTPKTKRGALRRYNAILNRCFKDAKGGLSFGLDWPTLRVLWPDRYTEIRSLRSIFKKLPA